MKRLSALAMIAVLALPAHVFAQQAEKVYRVAMSFPSPAATLAGPVPTSPALRVFIEAMKARGYVEGRNLILDSRSRFGLDSQGVENHMAEIVRTKPDVIVVDGIDAARSAKKFTSEIPIVMAASVDPVGLGLAHSLARPGMNVTGLVTDVDAGSEEKRMDLFLELLPKTKHLAFVGWKQDWENRWGKAVQDVAVKRGVDVFFAEGGPAGFADALEALKRKKSEAFYVAYSPRTTASTSLFVDFTLKNGIPSSCGITEMAESGCLMAYGQSFKSFFTHAATYVDKILKGAWPGNLPIEQPTRFELVINMKTARALGITIPPALLVRADRVIE